MGNPVATSKNARPALLVNGALFEVFCGAGYRARTGDIQPGKLPRWFEKKRETCHKNRLSMTGELPVRTPTPMIHPAQSMCATRP